VNKVLVQVYDPVNLPVTPDGKSTARNKVLLVFALSCVIKANSDIFTVDISYPGRMILPSSVVNMLPSSVVSCGMYCWRTGP
jgi:hypothetical protein